MQTLITDIEQEMLAHLDNEQLERLHNVLTHYLRGVTNVPQDSSSDDRQKQPEKFLAAKRVEGCSTKTLRYYESTQNLSPGWRPSCLILVV